MDDKRQRMIDELFDRAAEFEEKDEWSKAVNFYKQITELDPENIEAWLALGACFWNLRDLDSSRNAYKRILDIEPTNVDALTGYGRILSELGELEKAIEIYRKAEKINPENPIIYVGLGKVFEKVSQYRDAIKSYEKAAQLEKTNISLLNRIAELYIKVGDNINALKTYRRLVDIDSENYTAWAHIGDIFFQAQDYDRAEDAYKMALRVNPAFVEAQQGLKKVEKAKWELLSPEERQRIIEQREKEKQAEIERLREKLEKTDKKIESKQPVCPSCRKPIEPDWNTCPYCKATLNKSICPGCGARINPKWVTCPICGYELERMSHGSSELPSLSPRDDYLPTGIRDMDKILGNGLPPDSVIFLIYDTDSQIGAELFLLNYINQHLMRNMPVIYISDQVDIIKALSAKFGFNLSTPDFHFIDVKLWTKKLKNRSATQKIENVFGFSDSDLILQEGKYYLNSVITKYDESRHGLVICDFLPYFVVEIDKKELQRLIITMSGKLKERFSVIVPSDQNFMNILSPIKTLANVILRFRIKEEEDRLITQFSALVNDETLKRWVNFRIKKQELEFY